MNTALITRFGTDSEVLEKQRTVDDSGAIWGLVELWIALETTVSVKVQRFDSTDTCNQCVTVAPED